ncbi:ABC transporter ATP-binding protein [Paenibacillus sp. GCM10023252]|uniref:ABC transporter ATP-binding protein n=1 Tax=Paenibacillus sp. GCM10023252 TaxID=3252649 RepID=UPI00361C95B7
MASPLRQRHTHLEDHRDRLREAVELSSDPHELPESPLSQLGTSDSVRRGLSVALDGVAKSYGSSAVLHNLHLSVTEGEFIAIIGRSGCGKSTLLRTTAGLEPPSQGTISLGGTPVKGIQPEARVMFQDARLLPWLTVLDNVIIGIQGVSPQQARETAADTLRLVGLEDKARQWPTVLSGGQRQRVALARALVSQPQLLLLDEPLGALDALTRIEMQRLIEQLWEQRGFTALLVTHDVSEAVALADRVILLENGQITLDMTITLARPRQKDNSFSYYEKYLLDRLLAPQPDSAGGLRGTVYDI